MSAASVIMVSMYGPLKESVCGLCSGFLWNAGVRECVLCLEECYYNPTPLCKPLVLAFGI